MTVAVTVVVVLTVQREEWMAAAACRGLDPNIFFRTQGEPVDDARAICARCPVSADCLTYALDHVEMAGVWGGTVGRERRILRRQRAQSAA